eukprot:568577-Pyramimonas_sp.AAC.2
MPCHHDVTMRRRDGVLLRQVFAAHRYLIIGQQVSADNNLFTNIPTYREQLANMQHVDMHADGLASEHVPRARVAMRNLWQRGSSDRWVYTASPPAIGSHA